MTLFKGNVYMWCSEPFYCFNPTDHVNFVYIKCDLVHSLASLAGKILHWSLWELEVDILCHNFHINPRVMKVKSWTSFSSYQKLIRIGQCNLHKIIRFYIFFHWAVYKSCLHEVQAWWLFC